jgi:hypothetical protein
MEFVFASYPYIDRCTSRVDLISAAQGFGCSQPQGCGGKGASWWYSVEEEGEWSWVHVDFAFLPEPMHSLRRGFAVLRELVAKSLLAAECVEARPLDHHSTRGSPRMWPCWQNLSENW